MSDNLPFIAPEPHFTVVVLPGGAVHGDGGLLTGLATSSGDLVPQALRPAFEQAFHLRRPVRVSVGRANGTVETYLAAGDGQLIETPPHPRVRPPQPPDPRWTEGIPEGNPLLAEVREADRQRTWWRAQAAAGRLADSLHEEHGLEHPYPLLAWELQAYFAVRSHDWRTAAQLNVVAAGGRHHLGAPAEETERITRNAVRAWLRDSEHPESGEVGFALAHLLVRVLPGEPGPLAAVLRRLAGL